MKVKDIKKIIKSKKKYLISNRDKFVKLSFVLLAFLFVFDIQLVPSARFLSMVGKAQPTPLPTPTAENLLIQVAPESGHHVNLKWGDTGTKLVEAGGIDLAKYKENNRGKYEELMTYLTENNNEGITITPENAHFWVNTLWALGLTQKSDVLDKGVMGTEHRENLGNFASTGGWTLGTKDSVSLYSSADIIPLTQAQHDMVMRISGNIYRPCCGNPVAFPDCNHGMAILGLIELMASQGFSEEEIYKSALAFNSYWFTQTYMDLAYYFQTNEGLAWSDVEAKRVLGAEFSSGSGYAAIKKQIGDIPGSGGAGASCGV